jgi:hypothetical protein
MFEKDPFNFSTADLEMRAYREARREALRARGRQEAEIERELAELDRTIRGVTPKELEALRKSLADAKEPTPEQDAPKP